MRSGLRLGLSLASLEWKRGLRNFFLRQHIAIQVFLVLAFIYCAVELLVLAAFIEIPIAYFFRSHSIVEKCNWLLAYYLPIDIALRLMLQRYRLRPPEICRLLPIESRELRDVSLIGSMLSLFNIVPMVFVAVMALRIMPTEYGALPIFAWALAIMSLLLFNSFLVFALRVPTAGRSRRLAVLVITVVVVLAAQAAKYFSGPALLAEYLGLVLEAPIYVLAALVLYFCVFLYAQRSLPRYINVSGLGWRKAADSVGRSKLKNLLERLGVPGALLAVEWTSFQRVPRVRFARRNALLFMLSGVLFFFLTPNIVGYPFFIGMSIMCTGALMVFYSGFVFSWNSAFFELLLAGPTSIHDYLDAKYKLMMGFTIAGLVLSMPYVLLDERLLPVLFVAAIYNIGVNIPFILWVGTYNSTPVDLRVHKANNHQGTSNLQYLIPVVVLYLPILLFLPWELLDAVTVGLIVFACLGGLGVVFRRVILESAEAQLHTRKYKMLEGFRKQDGT